MNYIEKIENLELASLLEINLNSNLIADIENVESLFELELLMLAKNKLERLDALALVPSKKFKKLDASYNRISSSYLEDLCIVLSNL